MTPIRRLENLALTGFTIVAGLLWIFPLYWAFTTSIRTESRVVSDEAGLIPDEFNLSSYVDALFNTSLIDWYINSIGTSVIITFVVLLTGMMCVYALSQMEFPGRKALYLVVLASFMVPAQALVVPQFVLMNDMGLINRWGGIILP